MCSWIKAANKPLSSQPPPQWVRGTLLTQAEGNSVFKPEQETCSLHRTQITSHIYWQEAELELTPFFCLTAALQTCETANFTGGEPMKRSNAKRGEDEQPSNRGIITKSEMADLVPGLLICLMAVQTSQYAGKLIKPWHYWEHDHNLF